MGSKIKNSVPRGLLCISSPDQTRRRFLKLAGLGTLTLAAASRARAVDPEAAPLSAKSATAANSHERYMRRAIAMAKQIPEFPFGAVIVRQATGVIVAASIPTSLTRWVLD